MMAGDNHAPAMLNAASSAHTGLLTVGCFLERHGVLIYNARSLHTVTYSLSYGQNLCDIGVTVLPALNLPHNSTALFVLYNV